MANKTKRTGKKDERFFAAIAAGSSISIACAAAGYTRSTVYQWRDADQAFAALWDDANQVTIERMEAEADRRALQGTLRPVFYQGHECGHVREFSDVLLMFRLKKLDPSYRERIEHSGNVTLGVADRIEAARRRAEAPRRAVQMVEMPALPAPDSGALDPAPIIDVEPE